MTSDERARMQGIAVGLAAAVLVGLGCLAGPGCTATSTLKAIEASNRTDDVRSYVARQQHRSLLIEKFRNTALRINAAKTDEERTAILNEAWNDRNLFEFWVQQELLARATHIAVVDAKLESDRSTLDLLSKDIARKLRRPIEALDDFVAGRLGAALSGAATSRPAE